MCKKSTQCPSDKPSAMRKAKMEVLWRFFLRIFLYYYMVLEILFIMLRGIYVYTQLPLDYVRSILCHVAIIQTNVRLHCKV